jgi:alpha-tubulin suppressor-like RCC1 family protein
MNETGQLGNGLNEGTGPVAPIGLANPAKFAIGEVYTCAQLTDGHVTCWGDNATGVLGQGTDRIQMQPGPAIAFDPVLDIAGGSFHACVRRTDGVWCWGYNLAGQLGLGGAGCAIVPVRVTGFK